MTMIGCMLHKVALLVVIHILNEPALSQIVIRPSNYGQRDSFTNQNCSWWSCGQYSATCTVGRCCQCTCNSGRTFMSAMNRCESENEMAQGCNFMAQASKTAPWSFTPVTIASTDNMLTGFRIFHCKNSGCAKAYNCSASRVLYEDNGWKEFPASNDSRFDVQDDLLKIAGKECNRRRFEGLLLRFQFTCNLGLDLQDNNAETSCMVIKIAGNYRFGDVPTIGLHCPRNSTETVISKHWSLSTVMVPSSLHTMSISTSSSQSQSSPLASAIAESTIHATFVTFESQIKSSAALSQLHMTTTLFPYATVNSLSTEMTTGSDITTHGKTVIETITPSCTRQCGGGGVVTSVSSSTGQVSSVVTLFVQPTQGRSDKSDDMIHSKYFLLSSVVAAVAVFFVILLIIVLLLLRRKKRELQAKVYRSNFPNLSIQSQCSSAMAQRVSDDQRILTHCKFIKSDLSQSGAQQSLPEVVKLGSALNNEAMDGNELTCIEVPKFGASNSYVGTDEEYDVPADPPFLQRSLSLLYAKVDKSLKSYVADDDAIYTSVGSGISEITKVSDDINAIYDEPEEAVM